MATLHENVEQASVDTLLAVADRAILTAAVRDMEYPGLAVRMAELVGWPVHKALEKGAALLPAKATKAIHNASRSALMAALDLAAMTLDPTIPAAPRNGLHKLVTTASGVVTGYFGGWGMLVDLPLSTVILMRSIADVARSEGADIRDYKTRLQCVAVFAMGGKSDGDDDADSGYLVVRASLNKSIDAAARCIEAIVAEQAAKLGPKATAEALRLAVEAAVREAISKGTAPALVRFLVTVAERFSIQVTEKYLANALPVIGAIGGGVLNLAFADHFQKMAKAHFAILNLQRVYGEERITAEYRLIRAELRRQLEA